MQFINFIDELKTRRANGIKHARHLHMLLYFFGDVARPGDQVVQDNASISKRRSRNQGCINTTAGNNACEDELCDILAFQISGKFFAAKTARMKFYKFWLAPLRFGYMILMTGCSAHAKFGKTVAKMGPIRGVLSITMRRLFHPQPYNTLGWIYFAHSF